MKMSVVICLFVLFIGSAYAGSVAADAYKDQYCTDPRTMRKHAAYTEWADAYSCTRHRCQPGGRNLAIYTVGCKRVEAPESAIECEEVVEDTNMQFPFCCTRLRCLVVVRGEVWTRVLGQPWETLPAAPWSHMYKMKKPPPGAGAVFDKQPGPVGEGPIYELAEAAHDDAKDKNSMLRSGAKKPEDCDEPMPRTAPSPDIVIALATGNDLDEHKEKSEKRKKSRNPQNSQYYEEEESGKRLMENDDVPSGVGDKKELAMASEENSVTSRSAPIHNLAHQQVSWEAPSQAQWNSDPAVEPDNSFKQFQNVQQSQEIDKKEEKPNNLQTLVDAIGTRMKDIEDVVQKMSDKVQGKKETEGQGDGEKRPEHHEEGNAEDIEHKSSNPDGEHYQSSRFTVQNRNSKYLRSNVEEKPSSEKPLFIEDTNMNGYFSDAVNSLVKRLPKEPQALTYMAPVDNRRKASVHVTVTSDSSDENEKKHKKHTHKKKHSKRGGSHKKHHEKKKKFSKINSSETDIAKNGVSLEDDSGSNII